MREKFKSLDLYGQSVNFTWNGEEELKSTLGASVSLVLILALLAYSGNRLS